MEIFSKKNKKMKGKNQIERVFMPSWWLKIPIKVYTFENFPILL